VNKQKFLVRAIDYYNNRMETLKDTMEQAVPVAKEWALDGWSVEIVPVPFNYTELMTTEAMKYVNTIGPTYH